MQLESKMTEQPTARRILHCDVFAPRTGTGNPLAVILDSEGLSTAQMQAIAKWNNLAEPLSFCRRHTLMLTISSGFSRHRRKSHSPAIQALVAPMR